MANLIELLRDKHRDDLFVAECNTGSIWGKNIRRLDAWVMKRSWSPWETIGYEVKGSRQDFERDQKWAEYLPYCHRFYFVCERGLIQPNDLPGGVGLIWGTKDGEKLISKIPAARREVDLQAVNSLMAYVLMSRTVVVKNMYEANGVRVPNFERGAARDALIRQMVEQANERGKLAEFVRGHVRVRVDEARKRLADAEKLENQIKGFERECADRGLVWNEADRNWSWSKDLIRQAETKAGVIAHYGELRVAADQLASRLNLFIEVFNKAHKGG